MGIGFFRKYVAYTLIFRKYTAHTLIYTTGSAGVKNSVQCKIFQIEREKLHILYFWGLFAVIFGCFS